MSKYSFLVVLFLLSTQSFAKDTTTTTFSRDTVVPNNTINTSNEFFLPKGKVVGQSDGASCGKRNWLVLYCRGGKTRQDMTFRRWQDSSAGGKANQYDNIFYIEKANVGAGTNGENLQPGQCAYFNRAISRTEPSRLYFKRIQFSDGLISIGEKMLDNVERCAHNNNCIYRVCVANSSNTFAISPYLPSRFISIE